MWIATDNGYVVNFRDQREDKPKSELNEFNVNRGCGGTLLVGDVKSTSDSL